MSDTNNVSGTAFIIAEFRAEENEEIQPLYIDKIVSFFLMKKLRNHLNM